ncbi:trinucleotide repeat-containing gene 6C protein-like isoform X1 [Mytilus californianus]|uniref:trinucleotide repeat-containing gene 6C protein-like isoform X1 n=1 Tax=Mytilus californianus TaxID=6549 RepID=UPI0022455E6C|nr:trinucleotide repeat-containing gene 6C protein-like isoform X1 [Mytilus californianus]XP_052069648.1 trinucleotide repeat-containing gene 6C protein-like isoform X1 [Mytilus californianus]
MQQAAKPVNMNNQVNSGWGNSGPIPGAGVDEDDGGWGVGPPGVGSGWMGALAAANAELSSWQGPAGDWKPSVIVDRNDKEAWPSIGGDNSETTSDNGEDSASAKSGSVISSSSQDHTALWGNSLNGLESNTWDTNPNSSTWGSSYPQSLSNNMQGITSIAGSSDPSRGWGNVPGTLPQGLGQNLGGNRPQNSVQIQQSAAESMQSSHSVSNQASYGANTSAFKPVGDSWGAVGTIPSDIAGKGNGNSAHQKPEMMSEVGWPVNPPPTPISANSVSSWGESTVPTSMASTKQQWPPDSTQGLQPQPTSWAQAAGKGLSTSPSNPVSNQNAQSQSISQSDVPSDYRVAIDSHDGWGQKPVRQDTAWEMETTPKAKRKFPATVPTVNPEKPAAAANPNNNNSNMWNNNNGTGIWESTKEPQQTSSWTSAPAGNSAQWEDPQAKDPNTWTNPNDTTSSQWGGKTETGSWPSERSGQYGEAGKQEVNDGTALWGNPGGKPTNWNQPPNNPPNWNQAPPPPPPPTQPPGWGQPPPPPAKVDDGTCLWAAGSPKQAQAAGWGETNNQWNSAAVGQKPKTPSWSEDPSVKDDMFWNEDKSSNWEDTDMGTWMDETQENNSTWSSASGWIRGKKTLIKGGASRFPGGNQPQMRSRMIQQLMELGFQKDEAGQALISNNMNYQSALAELYKQKGATYRDDVLLESAKSKVISDNDISDTQQENNPFVPNPNTPFPPPNAQAFKGPSQPVSSQTSIMPPQQNKKPAAGRAQAVAQQMAQQQILQQLHLAVKAGLISPQLLNQQLPPYMLVLLQQLLQHQQCLQQLITTQQVLQKNSVSMNPMVQRQQLEQVNMKINTIKQQILITQRQIHDAQRLLIKPQPTATSQSSTEDAISTIESSLSNLNMTNSQPQQSKLSQWKKPTEKESSPDSGANTEYSALNKAPGSSKTSQASSQSSLQYGGLGLTQLGGDSTWSNVPATTSASQSWPTISVTSTGTTSIDENGKDIKESHLPSTSSSLTINDAIPEFVPGKPWPGITQKSVEDDPHITPGSFSRSLSLSVNTIRDDSLGSLITKTSPSESLPPINPKNMSQKSWSGGDSMTPTSFSNEVWGVPLPKNSAMQQRPPPGLKPNNWSGVNRQHSWAGTRTDPSSFNSGNMSNWDARMSNNITPCLILKNLTPQIDGSTLRTLCMQHGPLVWFYLSLNNGQALVRYHSKEEAFKAQKSLNTCVLGNTTIVADFVSDNEAARFAMTAQSSSQWQSQQPNNSAYRQNSMGVCNDSWNQPAQANHMANNYNSGGMWGNGGSGLWGGDDHNANSLLGNMLGESM